MGKVYSLTGVDFNVALKATCVFKDQSDRIDLETSKNRKSNTADAWSWGISELTKHSIKEQNKDKNMTLRSFLFVLFLFVASTFVKCRGFHTSDFCILCTFPQVLVFLPI